MCLAIPGKVLDLQDSEAGPSARVQFGAIVRPVRLDFVPEAMVGDYVMVHVGFAISRVNPEEARGSLDALKEMGFPDDELTAGEDASNRGSKP